MFSTAYCFANDNIMNSHVVLFVSTVICIVVLCCIYYVERSSIMFNYMYICSVIVP